MGKFKRFTALALTVSLCVAALTGCTSSSTDAQASSSASADATTSSTSMNHDLFTYNIGAVSKTIDPQLNASVDGATIDVNLFEGLLNEDSDGNISDGVAYADKTEVSDDGLHYVYHLRDDAKWSDGQPVTAHDFEYAWKRAIDPATASEYVYQMYPIKNAEAASTGDCPLDDVGVKATDDYTLEVDLEYPCSYFDSLLSSPTYMPVRQDVVEANPDTWATSADTLICNGKYYLTEWAPKDHYIFTANPNYWNASSVKLPEFRVDMVTDSNASYAAYQAGQYDIIDALPTSVVQQALADGTATQYPGLGNYFYVVNLDEEKASQVDPAAAKALQDPNVRQAINLAIDRNAIVKIANGGQVPATSFVPPGMTGPDGTDFCDVSYFPAEGDVPKAQELLAEAGYPDGKGFPTIILSYNNDAPAHQDIAQTVQSMLQQNLGITVQLQGSEWQAFQTQRTTGDYEIARHAWYADYRDPMTFLDMWTSDSSENVAFYSNPEYDTLIENAKNELDPQTRWDDMHQAESILMTDLPVIPIYYATDNKGVQPYVKGYQVSPLGYSYFDQITVNN